MSKIESIETLISEFESAAEKDRSKILNRINIQPNEFEKFATWKDGEYTRNCLARTVEFEFILLCWDSRAETAIHDHGGQDCWVYQVTGEVEEMRYSLESDNNLKPTLKTILESGRLTYMNDKMGFHRLKNISKNGSRAMTLHIYASPIDQCRVLNSETRNFEEIKMAYDSFSDQVVHNH